MLTLDLLLPQVAVGLTRGMLLFLVASGLTLIFGMLRVINFAHGAFYMLGAYLAVSVAASIGGGLGFVAALAIVPLIVALFGGATERILFKRIYQDEHLNQIVLAYALALVMVQSIVAFWGGSPRATPPPPILRGAVEIAGVTIPVYALAVVAIGLLIAAAMGVVLARTRAGWQIRAAVDQPLTAASLGINVNRLMTIVFMVGIWLAAFAGVLTTPLAAATPGMDVTMLIEAFAVIVIGGVGSVVGALVAAILVGLSQSIGLLFLPRGASLIVFAIMVVILVVRPQGLFGQKELQLK